MGPCLPCISYARRRLNLNTRNWYLRASNGTLNSRGLKLLSWYETFFLISNLKAILQIMGPETGLYFHIPFVYSNRFWDTGAWNTVVNNLPSPQFGEILILLQTYKWKFEISWKLIQVLLERVFFFFFKFIKLCVWRPHAISYSRIFWVLEDFQDRPIRNLCVNAALNMGLFLVQS